MYVVSFSLFHHCILEMENNCRSRAKSSCLGNEAPDRCRYCVLHANHSGEFATIGGRGLHSGIDSIPASVGSSHLLRFHLFYDIFYIHIYMNLLTETII